MMSYGLPTPDPDSVNLDQNELAAVMQQLEKQFEGQIAPFNPPVPAGQKMATEQNTTPDGGSAPVEPQTDAGGQEDPAEEADGPPLEEQLRSLSSEYGVPFEDLEGFTNVDDARHALRFLDNQFVQLGREQLNSYAPPTGQSAADVQFQQQPLPSFVQPPPTTPPSPDNQAIEQALREMGEDTAAGKLLRTLYQQQQAQQQQLVAWQQQQAQQLQQQQIAEQQRALSETLEVLQELNPERYGKGNRITVFQETALRKALEHADYMITGMQQRRAPVPSRRELAKRIDDVLFSTENEKQRRRQAAAASTRNGARLGQPSAARQSKSQNEEWKGPIEEDPTFQQIWDEIEARG